MLTEQLLKIQVRERKESDVKSDLLLMLVSKPIKFLTEFPSEWDHCLHVDLNPDDNWLDEACLRPILNHLVGALAHSGRIPVDICAVKSHEVYSIVVRTEELAKAAA